MITDLPEAAILHGLEVKSADSIWVNCFRIRLAWKDNR